MNSAGAVLITLIIIKTLGGNAVAAFGDPLWEGAVNNHQRYDRLYARRIETEATEFDGRGNRRAVRETTMAVTLDSDGLARSVLTAVRDNGTDVPLTDVTTSASAAVTADSSDAAAEGREAAMTVMHLSPFDPRLQDRVTYRRVSGSPDALSPASTSGSGAASGAGAASSAASGPPFGPRPTDREQGTPEAGEPTVEFQFTVETPTQLISGNAWLRERDGVPVRSKATLEPLPRFVRELVVEQFFAESEAGHHVSTVRILAEGGFLFFRRRSEITMRFLDHAE